MCVCHVYIWQRPMLAGMSQREPTTPVASGPLLRYAVQCSSSAADADDEAGGTVDTPKDAGVASWQILGQLE